MVMLMKNVVLDGDEDHDDHENMDAVLAGDEDHDDGDGGEP